MHKAEDIFEILITPVKLAELAPSRQANIVHQARHAALLGYLEARIPAQQRPGKLADHLQAAKVQADFQDTLIAREIGCLTEALAQLPGPVVLLKGAAYRAIDASVSAGRLASDIDLLLPREQINTAENLLLEAGWFSLKEDEYDDHYYRAWMHELPPLRHEDRGTIVDLHHNILPPTSRLCPDAGKLLEDAVLLSDSPLYTLSPADTLLHRCVHLFVDGDMHNSLRELVDINNLLNLYSSDAEFHASLLPRARTLGLTLPLYYGLYFSHSLLQAPVEDAWLEELESTLAVHHRITRALMGIALRPGEPGRPGFQQRSAEWLLYLRSHCLRMPPLMLARHLFHQAWRRGGLRAG